MLAALPTRRRRIHSTEFKSRLVDLCQQPGTSVAAVALVHGLNANLLRRWIKQYQAHAPMPVAVAAMKMVPVQIARDDLPQPTADIQLDIQHGKTRVNIRWPTAEAASCAQWLGAWLK